VVQFVARRIVAPQGVERPPRVDIIDAGTQTSVIIVNPVRPP